MVVSQQLELSSQVLQERAPRGANGNVRTVVALSELNNFASQEVASLAALLIPRSSTSGDKVANSPGWVCAAIATTAHGQSVDR